MDSLTQLTLGAAVGVAVMGRRTAVWKAAAWGAVAGTLPDLDVLGGLVLSEPAMLRFHRGLTHSLLFAFVAAPLLGWLSAWVYRKRAGPLAEGRVWAVVWFWGMWTHPLLDVFTGWGTQLFWPLSDRSFALASVFIIDPLYTLPLLAAVGYAAIRRDDHARRRAVTLALAVSTLYLGWGLAVQAHARRVFRAELGRQGLAYDRLLVQPSPLNSVLWDGLVRTPDGFLQGYYGLLDGDRRVAFRRVPRTTAPLDPVAGTDAGRTLAWFAKGWLTAERDGSVPLAHDLRFSRSDLWLNPGPAPYVFTFRFVREGGRWTFHREGGRLDRPSDLVRRFGRRVRGDESADRGHSEPLAPPRVPDGTTPSPPRP